MYKLLENDKQFLNELKGVILKEKSPYEEDDFISVPMKKIKCQKMLALYKRSVARYKLLGKQCAVIKKKFGVKSKQYERCDEHYENALQDSDELAIAYEKQCKKKAPYYG